jgi:hypothetical protein
LSGREGLGSSLPLAELARRDLGIFEELKRLFSTTPKSEKKQKRTKVIEVTRRWTRRGLCLTRRVRSAFSICACFSLVIGRAARPVTIDRTRPVIQGAYWTPTGRWHCGVRSVLQHVRSLFRCALLRLDQRVRSVMGPARPVAPSAFGLCDQRVRSVLCSLAVVRPTRPISVTSASGQRDFGSFKVLTAIFEGVRL